MFRGLIVGLVAGFLVELSDSLASVLVGVVGCARGDLTRGCLNFFLFANNTAVLRLTYNTKYNIILMGTDICGQALPMAKHFSSGKIRAVMNSLQKSYKKVRGTFMLIHLLVITHKHYSYKYILITIINKESPALLHEKKLTTLPSNRECFNPSYTAPQHQFNAIFY